MKEFQFYINNADVKKQKPDKNTSNAVFRDALERIEHAKMLLDKAKAKYVLENAYESIREAADALLYSEGYKSFSHEASIAYLSQNGFDEKEIKTIDTFRKIRNSIKYYGGDCQESEAKQSIQTAEQTIKKIKKILEK